MPHYSLLGIGVLLMVLAGTTKSRFYRKVLLLSIVYMIVPKLLVSRVLTRSAETSFNRFTLKSTDTG